MTTPDTTSAEAEHRHHDYAGHDIPWYVRLLWFAFWSFVVYYTLRFLFPALQVELFQQS